MTTHHKPTPPEPRPGRTPTALNCGHLFAIWNAIPAAGDEVWCYRCNAPATTSANRRAHNAATLTARRHAERHRVLSTESGGGKIVDETGNRT